MTVLDASALIAHLSSSNVHHDRATELIRRSDDGLAISPITLTEVMVGPVRDGTLGTFDAAVRLLGLRTQPLPADAPLRLAQLRASTGLRLPDCCVLLAAEQQREPLATFDQRLADAARSRGVSVLGA